MQPGKYYAAAEAADILPGVERLSQPGGRAAEELIAFVSLCDEVWRQTPMIFPVTVMCAIPRWGTVRSVRVRRGIGVDISSYRTDNHVDCQERE